MSNPNSQSLDRMSCREIPVYGRPGLERANGDAKAKGGVVLRVEQDQNADDPERLTVLVIEPSCRSCQVAD
jgi:hypothetical protein